jgi:hypothetical protein
VTEEAAPQEEGATLPSIEEMFSVIQAHHHALQGISKHLMEVAGRVGEIEAVLDMMLSEAKPEEPSPNGH